MVAVSLSTRSKITLATREHNIETSHSKDAQSKTSFGEFSIFVYPHSAFKKVVVFLAPEEGTDPPE